MIAQSLIVFVALAGAFANVVPFQMSQLPEQYKEFIPQEIRDFYKSLTDDEKQIFREMASSIKKYDNEEAALTAIKEKSESLYEKANKLHSFIKEKIESLEPEAKKFVDETIATLRTLRPADGKLDLPKIKTTISEIIVKYKGLSDEAKENLKITFPNTSKMVENETFKKLMKEFLDDTK